MQTKHTVLILSLLALITVGCLGTGAVASTPTVTVPTPVKAALPSEVVFTTPEEAITAYLQGVAQHDPEKILQACAINEMSEKFKFDVYAERLGNVFLPAQFLSPADDPFYVEANKLQLSSQILSRVKIFVYSLLSSEKVDDSSVITNMDAARIAKFMKDVDPKRLSGLELKKIGLAGKTIMDSAKYRDNAAKSALSYGADDSTERLALFSFEQNDYYLGFTLLRYGDNWKISTPTSALANTNALGAPEKTTAEDFDSLTNR
jgi:hypothetical protein